MKIVKIKKKKEVREINYSLIRKTDVRKRIVEFLREKRNFIIPEQYNN